jgi:5-methylcytosine-specific restriction endonuclease McrA
MGDELYAAVRFRAGFRCEYCRLPEASSDVSFPIDHIIARQHGGRTTLDNLALACPRCNAYKGTNLATVDWPAGNLTRLYHPRQDRWADHFRWEAAVIVGVTPVGQATAKLLNMNSARRVATRLWLMQEGLF